MRPFSRGRLFTLGAALVVSTSFVAAYAHAQQQTGSPAPMVLTRGGGLILTDTAGGNARQILSGARPGRVTYPWYAWSPDGKYLLVVQVADPPSSAWDLLILDANGTVLRRIKDAQAASGFYPNWAIDGDRVAYLSNAAPGARTATVRWVKPDGSSHVLFSVPQQAGCGGGIVDPAAIAYQRQTADGGMMFPLQWSIKQHAAFAWVGTGSALVDTRTGIARHLGTAHQEMGDAVLSPSGQIAAAMQVCGKTGCAGRIVVIDGGTLRVTRDLGAGELPTWSPDGGSLYFVRRVKIGVLSFKDSMGNVVASNVYRTSLWRADATGQGLRRLVREDAYGFGLLNVAPHGGSLVFSRVDNATVLWQHRLKNGRFNSGLVKRFGPSVAVQRWSQEGGLVTLTTDSGLPSVRP